MFGVSLQKISFKGEEFAEDLRPRDSARLQFVQGQRFDASILLGAP